MRTSFVLAYFATWLIFYTVIGFLYSFLLLAIMPEELAIAVGMRLGVPVSIFATIVFITYVRRSR